jgi:RNA polymerase sigma-70 factor (ECF subfamily)
MKAKRNQQQTRIDIWARRMVTPDRKKEALLNAAKSGNDDALGELIEEFRPLLRAEAMQSLAEVQARVGASDVVQLTWWSAFRAFPRFEGDVDAFIGWLRNIHECNIKDAVRDQHADKRAIGREVAASGVLPVAPGKITTASQRLVRREQQEQMDACLKQLPVAQREAIRLRFYEGLAVAEIVERMGRSETAVAGLLKRGLSTLRQLMKDEG